MDFRNIKQYEYIVNSKYTDSVDKTKDDSTVTLVWWRLIKLSTVGGKYKIKKREEKCIRVVGPRGVYDILQCRIYESTNTKKKTNTYYVVGYKSPPFMSINVLYKELYNLIIKTLRTVWEISVNNEKWKNEVWPYSSSRWGRE